MPSAGGSYAADAREIGIVRYSPELHMTDSGKNSVIDPFEHFADDSGAKFVLQQVNGSLARQGRIRPMQPGFRFFFLAKHPVGERLDVEGPGQIQGLIGFVDNVVRRELSQELSRELR